MTNIDGQNGVISKASLYPVAETLDRLEAVLQAKGIRVFARIDQRTAAEEVGLALRPTELLVFGDPRSGTPLMNRYPLLALDLPLKALAWEDEAGKVWLSYNESLYLARRYALENDPFLAVASLMEAALA